LSIPLVGRRDAHDDGLGGGGALLSHVRVHLAPAKSCDRHRSEITRNFPHRYMVVDFGQEFTCSNMRKPLCFFVVLLKYIEKGSLNLPALYISSSTR
jgi:hypothetical protein